MKKLLILLAVMLIGTNVFAAGYSINIEASSKVDKEIKKAHEIGYKIMKDNNLRRAPIFVIPGNKTINAYSDPYSKTVRIYTGLLPYLDNDDEWAYIISHELSHSMEAYDGFVKIAAMSFNSKKYEYKADLNGIDYMVKAGYNPVAAIIAADKINPEPSWDWASTHPKGSKRMLEMYKYIYVKYPQYLNSPMTGNIIYRNFLSRQSTDIKKFEQQYAKRRLKKESI
ncbi:MAG: M48 family metallopeptidase [Heliobacteriaceae bacterium]|jgi:predicted Zn-dependent protease|nr:M48 family metallopeptidase [Heliobacteriaceae bacterium]